jgi:hypothetical protein
MWVSDEVGTDAGIRLLSTPPAEQRRHRVTAACAFAALEEVAKFLPDGADRIPEALFTSDRGRETYRKNPSRFEPRGCWAVRSATGASSTASTISAPRSSDRLIPAETIGLASGRAEVVPAGPVCAGSPPRPPGSTARPDVPPA